MADINHPVFRMPSLLQEVIRWEQECAAHVPYLERPSGLFLGIEGDGNGYYLCSPIDSIRFADTGMDGIHYAFLTDFDANQDLAKVPIICVSPMDFDNAVRLVACNLRQFFQLWFSHDGWGRVLLLNDFESDEAYACHIRKQMEETCASDSFDQERYHRELRAASASAVHRFGLQDISNPVEHIRWIRQQRKPCCLLPTQDGLGIMPLTSSTEKVEVEPHPWSAMDIEYEDLQALDAFLSNSSIEAILSFVRDYQHQGVVHEPSLRLIGASLQQHGFELEAKKLRDAVFPFLEQNRGGVQVLSVGMIIGENIGGN